LLFETPKEVPLSFSYNRDDLRKKYIEKIFPKSRVLSEDDSKLLINDYGIPTTHPELAANEDDAVRIAEKKGYPVVLKISSHDIIHKSDMGGVALNIESEGMVRASYHSIMECIGKNEPKAEIEGITVQKMIRSKEPVELILGIKKDPAFGTIMMVGMGGITAELFKDRRLEFPPLNEHLARQMLKSLQIYPLLTGYRGREAKHIDKLIEVIIRLSYLAADYPEIEELDVNPLIVTADNVIALDARIVIDQDLVGSETRDYSHLILRPYPERLIKPATLSDGTMVILRPIKPEDEPLWLEMLGSCSKQSIYSRFRYDFYFDSHEVATQFCFIDYDREMAIVAEVEINNRKKLIGVGRLIGDPDVEIAEYAVLITDEWQHKDLGQILTSYCIEIAGMAGVKRVSAETTKDNKPMISVFRKMGFKVFFNDDTTVTVSKDLE